MIPGTTLTDFDHIDPEFSVFCGHFVQLFTFFDAPSVLPELIPVDVDDVSQVALVTGRAGLAGLLAVELGRPQEGGAPRVSTVSAVT